MSDSQLCNGIGLKQRTTFCGKEQSKKIPVPEHGDEEKYSYQAA